MLSWERYFRVEAPDRPYVVRVHPTGEVPKMYPSTGGPFAYLSEWLRLRLRRDRSWTVTLRHAEDDPAGPALLEERLPSKRTAIRAVAVIEEHLREEAPSGGR